MRVFLNDRETGGFDPGLERSLDGLPSEGALETMAWSDQDSIRARSGELILLLFGTSGLLALLLCINLIVVALRAPQVLGYAAAAFAGGAGFTAGLVALLYVLMLGAHRRRLEARQVLPQLPVGTVVRLDDVGLSIDGRLRAWRSLIIDEVRVRRRLGSQGRVTGIERLVLSDGGSTTPLDAVFLGDGRAVLRQAWRQLRAAAR